MTALAGYWSFGAADPAPHCARMLKGQEVYAAARPLSWSGGPLAMGRRLWSLLPEDRFDRGPVVSEAGVLVADLRLDNREELAEAIGIAPADVRTLSDAALLMKAIERWDEAAVDRLAGEFAFAWWNPQQQVLLLARDFMGNRPLHYHRGDGFFAFASMAKGLHALPAVPYGPDRGSVAAFLALVPETGSETYFEGIEKVVAGEIAAVTSEGVRPRRYWPRQPRTVRLAKPEDYEEAMREQLDRAVAVRLRGAEGRVAAHLSAGLDSSAVAATAARLLAREGQGGRVTAFTAAPREGYAVPRSSRVIGDEWPLAASVAAMYPNMDHVRISVAAGSPTADLGRYFHLFERPFLNLCNGVWLTATLEEAKRRRLGVLLTGVAGNASFSYDGMASLHGLLKRGKLVRLAGQTLNLKRNGTRLGSIAAQVLGPVMPRPLWRAVERLRGAPKGLASSSLLSDEAAAAYGIAERARERGLDLDYRPRGDPDAIRLRMLSRMDQGNYKKGTLAGWGVDLRDPAADQRLIEFCLAIPVEQFSAGGRPRSLARRSFADRLPAALLAERRKGLQAIDWHEGLDRREIGEEMRAIADCAPAAEAIDVNAMQRLLDDWPEGRWHDRDVVSRYRLALLRGISAGRFIRQALGANR